MKDFFSSIYILLFLFLRFSLPLPFFLCFPAPLMKSEQNKHIYLDIMIVSTKRKTSLQYLHSFISFSYSQSVWKYCNLELISKFKKNLTKRINHASSYSLRCLLIFFICIDDDETFNSSKTIIITLYPTTTK